MTCSRGNPQSDFPVVQGVVLVVSLIVVAVNLLALAYAALDPRIRTEAA